MLNAKKNNDKSKAKPASNHSCIKIWHKEKIRFTNIYSRKNMSRFLSASRSVPSGWFWCLPWCSCPACWLCTPATAAPQLCSLQSHPAALGAWPASPGDRRRSPAPPMEDHYYSVAQVPEGSDTQGERQEKVDNTSFYSLLDTIEKSQHITSFYIYLTPPSPPWCWS